MNVLSANVLAVLLASSALPERAFAQQVPDEPVPAAFHEVTARLAGIAGVNLGRPVLRRAPTQIGNEQYRFVESLPAHQQSLNFDLNLINQPGIVVDALKSVRSALEATCGSRKLEHSETAPRVVKVVFGQATDGLMGAAYQRLYDERLVGRFDCAEADGRLAWTMTVHWNQGEREPAVVIPSGHWRFRLESISPERLQRQQIRFSEFKRKTDALRANPEAATAVQVLFDDLPASVASQYGRPFNPDRVPLFVCGLVTSSRDGVAEVQFGKERIAVPTTKLFPIGSSVSVAEMALYMEAKAPPYRTCLRA